MHGLPNVGATCYLNAAVQLLRAAQNRVGSLIIDQTPLDQVLTVESPTATMMSNLVRYIQMPSGQQDSQEALQYIIEKSKLLSQQTQFKMRSQMFCLNCTDVTATKTAMENMFICSPTPDPTLHKCITPMSTLHHEASLSDQRTTTMSPTILPLGQYIRRARTSLSGWRCERCKNSCNAIKEDSFATIADIILIVFPRYCSPKEPLAYDCPDNLRYYCKTNGQLKENVYDFVGSVDHSGSLGGGHYTARVNSAGQAWFCNDSLVQICNSAKPGPNTVIVAYKRR